MPGPPEHLSLYEGGIVPLTWLWTTWSHHHRSHGGQACSQRIRFPGLCWTKPKPAAQLWGLGARDGSRARGKRPEQGWLSQSSTSYCTPPKPAPHLKYGAPCPGQNRAGAGWLDMELHRSQAPHVCLQGSSSLLSVPGLTQPCLVLRTISPTTLRVC